DRIFRGHLRGYLTSDYVYPRPAFTEEERQHDERRLMDMDLAVESVLTANQAVLTLMRGLGLRPDVCLGHSTGEYSALFASGVLGLTSEAEIADFTRELNLLYVDADAEDGVPQAMMLAIAADREQVEAIARQAGGDVFLAMDNCPHQTVLVGRIADVERARDIAQSLGLIYEQLTFDRAYHTPLFAEYADQLRSAFARTPIQTAQLPVFSCTTGQPYPDDPDAVRDLMVEHWASPVKFQTTIERLYNDGVRIFVEVGARGNLTAFVEDILRGRPMAAIPANVQRRSGISQLNHLVAMLSVQGVELNWDFLWRRRNVRQVAWHEGFERAQRTGNGILLLTSWPMLRLSDDTYRRVRSLSGSIQAPAVEPPADQPPGQVPQVRNNLDEPVAAADVAYSPSALEDVDSSVTPDWNTGDYVPAYDRMVEPVEAGSAIDDYFETMEHFLEIQRAVMSGYLSTDDGRGNGWHPIPTALDSSQSTTLAETELGSRYPLLGDIVYESPGEALVSRRVFDPNVDRYLLDHTLGRSVSSIDPELRALALMPLTMSLEIVAEAASRLVPEWFVVGFRAVNAHRWIAWEDEPRTLEISARLVAVDERQAQVRVALSDLGAIGTRSSGEVAPVVEAIVLLSDAYPEAPDASLVGPLDGAGPSRWRREQLYSEVMFHGPSWQGVTKIDRTSEGGCSATLRTLPVDGFLAGCPEPCFEIDPVTLDAAGQVIGFWTAEQLATGRVIFPYRVEAIDLFGPPLSPGWELSCRADIDLLGKAQLRSNIELTDEYDRPVIWLTGWEDKRFELPAQFEPLLLDAGAGAMSSSWPEL
ncbi:MAG TPA: acyltransferase domain-containing protein, partial [Thermomicrobiaceae bacterium]|nr:acyltransferase domain-containing protein [Thermomicrobiaceae bacterium]